MPTSVVLGRPLKDPEPEGTTPVVGMMGELPPKRAQVGDGRLEVCIVSV
jgi:hypothetical protein